MINYTGLLDCINGNKEGFKNVCNNSETMLWIIKKTKNLTYFENCDHSLKDDYKFVCEVLNIFKSNPDICFKIIDEYLNKEVMIGEVFEVICYALIIKINFNAKQTAYLLNFFENIMSEIISEAKKNVDVYASDDFNLYQGFYFILNNNSDYPSSLNMLTESFLYDFQNETDLYFEIHKRFKSKQELMEYGFNNFILEKLSIFDKFLAEHVALDIFYLQDIKDSLNNSLEHWESFEDVVYNKILSMILDVAEENDISSIYLIYYFGYVLDCKIIQFLVEMFDFSLDCLDEVLLNEILTKYNLACKENLTDDEYLKLLLPDLTLVQQKDVVLLKKELKKLLDKNLKHNDKIIKFKKKECLDE